VVGEPAQARFPSPLEIPPPFCSNGLDALVMVKLGRIADAKTIVGILYFARFEADVP
jgi:hypothetical protein